MTERTEIATVRLLTDEEFFREATFLDDSEGVKPLRARIEELAAENAQLRFNVEDLSAKYGELWMACDWMKRGHGSDEVLSVMERQSYHSPTLLLMEEQ